jgi:glutamate dehydrogenase
MLPVHPRPVKDLERNHGLDRELPGLPTARQFAALQRDGEGLSVPELANLLAHVKLALKTEVLAGDRVEEEAFVRRLREYFPAALWERFGRLVDRHPLRPEITTTLLVNDVVDNGGPTYAFRLGEEVAVDPADAVRAFAVVSEVYDLRSLWHWLDTQGTELPTAVTDELALEIRRLLDRASRWMLSHRPQPLNAVGEVSRLKPVVAQLEPLIMNLLRGRERRAAADETRRLADLGIPEALAQRIACVLDTYALLDIAKVNGVTEVTSEHTRRATADLYFALSEHLSADLIRNAVSALERGRRWHSLARLALRDDLYGSLRAVTLGVLLTSNPGESTSEKIACLGSGQFGPAGPAHAGRDRRRPAARPAGADRGGEPVPWHGKLGRRRCGRSER